MNLNPLVLSRTRQSLTHKLRQEAHRREVSVDLVRKQYLFSIFLSQLFRAPDTPWILVGGNALLIRTGGGRFTQDIDLARSHEWDDPGEAMQELQAAVNAGRGDSPFEFQLERVKEHSTIDESGYGALSAKIHAVGTLGGIIFERFNIDISTRRHTDAPVDYLPLLRVIDHETLDDLPTIPTTPIEPHLADKVCALYELHGDDQSSPSTRYRDLADLVRLITSERVDAARLQLVLKREEGRRGITLPKSLITPGPAWAKQYPNAARTFAEYPSHLVPLQASLDFAGTCLNEVLSGIRRNGSWNPDRQRWED